MNKFAGLILKLLEDSISMSEENSRSFVKNPKKDFTRKRKLSYSEMIRLILSMGGQSIKLELLDYFSYSTNTVSCSAFVQQRDKLLPKLFESIFHDFNSKLPSSNRFKGYRLMAVDGSDLSIAHNPNDTETYQANGPNKGCNLLHLNAMFDLCNRTYVDGILQGHKKVNERKALIEMVERSLLQEKVIVIADRGYESYNVLEHISKKGWNYIIRIKDVNSNGMASTLKLPLKNIFDIDYSLLITRRQTNEIKAHKELYKFMPKNQAFDFLSTHSKDVYPFNFRILRFPISDNSYEVIITNLNRNEFSLDEIKKLYHMRWGVETSFRELKYALGLRNFHAKKVEYIIQEVFARLIMYNFCEAITAHVVIQQKDTTHMYQVNFTVAIAICMRYFSCRKNIPPPDVEALIRKNILPVRHGRKDPRKVKFKSTVSFLYRVA